MDLTTILAGISVAARFASLALQIGISAKPFLDFIEKAANTPNSVTRADFDSLYAMSKPFFDKLNDTSRDK